MKQLSIVVVLVIVCLISSISSAETFMLESVPFRVQSPPGDWDYNMNCGPASALMVADYWHNGSVSEQSLKDVIDWLYQQNYISEQTNPSAEHYDGNVTNTTVLTNLLQQYFGFQNVVKKNQHDFNYIKQQIKLGRPVIMAVNIRMNPDLFGHFMVAVGFDDNGLFVHDPGRTYGANNYYTWQKISLSWVSSLYSSLVVLSDIASPVIVANSTWHPNGSLLMLQGSNKIYLVIEQKLYWILDENIFNAHQFDWSKIITINQTEFDCYDLAGQIDWAPYREYFQVNNDYYLLEKASADSTGCAYYRFGNKLAWQSWKNDFAFKNYSFEEAQNKYFSNCTAGRQLYIRDGTLVKPDFALNGYGAGVIFVASDNGQLSAFENLAVFQSLGYENLPVLLANQIDFENCFSSFTDLISEQQVFQCHNQIQPEIDNDGDGISASAGDCNDNNNQIFPGQEESCDNLDNNCNGYVDDFAKCSTGYECLAGSCTQIIQTDGDVDQFEAVEAEIEIDLDMAQQYLEIDVTDDDIVDSFDLDVDDIFVSEEIIEAPEEDLTELDQSPDVEVDEVNPDINLHCTVSCPADMIAFVWYGETGQQSGQTVELDISKQTLCERGRPWIDFNCACSFPDLWSCHDWHQAQIECNQNFRTMDGIVDYNGEGEMWFYQLTCW